MAQLGGYKIGAVSLRTGLSPTTLRIWEEHYGLLHPDRSSGGTRLYSEGDVQRILEVKELLRSGRSLQAISQVIDKARADYPDVVRRLVEVQSSLPSASHLLGDVRTFLEQAQVREATDRERIREGSLVQRMYFVLRRIQAAPDMDRACAALVTGARELTGVPRTSLAVYERPSDALRMVSQHHGQRVFAAEYGPWPIGGLRPAGWRDALRRQVPFYAPTIAAGRLRPEHRASLLRSGVRSFFAHPLTVGSDLVGVLILAGTVPDGVRPEARQIGSRLGTLAAGAIGYYVLRAEATNRS